MRKYNLQLIYFIQFLYLSSNVLISLFIMHCNGNCKDIANYENKLVEDIYYVNIWLSWQRDGGCCQSVWTGCEVLFAGIMTVFGNLCRQHPAKITTKNVLICQVYFMKVWCLFYILSLVDILEWSLKNTLWSLKETKRGFNIETLNWYYTFYKALFQITLCFYYVKT